MIHGWKNGKMILNDEWLWSIDGNDGYMDMMVR